MMMGGAAGSSLEDKLKLAVAIVLLLWNAIEGSVLENEYPALFVRLYPLAIWRVFLVLAILAGALWCPTVGILLAYAIFFYVMDMEITMDKW
jgi:hypothetical protein